MEHTVELPTCEPVMRVIPLPADMNANGDIFGGWVMSQVDLAGSVLAMRRARGRIATARAWRHFGLAPPSAGGGADLFPSG